MWRCRLYTLWLNIRYINIGIMSGMILLGHDFKYTDEVVHDYWVIECSKCGIRAGCDIAPDRKPPKA